MYSNYNRRPSPTRRPVPPERSSASAVGYGPNDPYSSVNRGSRGYNTQTSPRSSADRVVPISEQTYVNGVPVSSNSSRNSSAYASDYVPPRRSTYAEPEHTYYRPSSISGSSSTQPSSRTTNSSSRLAPAVHHPGGRAPSADSRPSQYDRDSAYVTPSSTNAPRERRKVYPIDSRRRDPEERDRDHRSRDSYDADAPPRKDGRDYHLSGPAPPRAPPKVEDSYEYTDARGMFDSTEPIRRPRRGSVDAVSRDKPVGVDSYDSRGAARMGAPPPATRALDRIKDATPQRHNSLRDVPATRSPPRDRKRESFSEDENYRVPPRINTGRPADPAYAPGPLSPTRSDYTDPRDERRTSKQWRDSDIASRGFGLVGRAPETYDDEDDRQYPPERYHPRRDYPVEPARDAPRRELEKPRDAPRDREREYEQESRRDREREAPRDREPEAYREREGPRDREPDLYRDRERDRERELPPREKDVDREWDREREMPRDRNSTTYKDRERDEGLNRPRDKDSDAYRERDRPRDKDSDVYPERDREKHRYLERDPIYDEDRKAPRERPRGYEERDRERPQEYEERDRERPLEYERERDRNSDEDRTAREKPRDRDDRSRRERNYDERRDDREDEHGSGLLAAGAGAAGLAGIAGLAKSEASRKQRQDPSDEGSEASEPRRTRRARTSPGDEEVRERHYVNPDESTAREHAREASEESVDPDEEFRRRIAQEAQKMKRPAPEAASTGRDRGYEPEPEPEPAESRQAQPAIETPQEPQRELTDEEKRRNRYRPPNYQDPPPPPSADSQALARIERHSDDEDGLPIVDEPDEISDSSAKRENRVSIVEPPRANNAPKGILRKPTAKFPEDPNPIREGVAPLKDTSKKGVPPGARWTKIARNLVSPAALEEAQERFEVRQDYVIVLRVVSHDEIQKFADRTKEIRDERYEKEHARDEKDSHSHRHRDRDRERDRDRDRDEGGHSRHKRSHRHRDEDDEDDEDDGKD